MGKFTETSIVDFVTAVEEDLRAKALEGSRSSQCLPFGKALVQSLRDHVSRWQERRDMLKPIRASPSPGLDSPSMRKGGKAGKSGKGGKSDFLPPPPPQPMLSSGSASEDGSRVAKKRWITSSFDAQGWRSTGR